MLHVSLRSCGDFVPHLIYETNWRFADDIASTLWTMIEENVAIICACLPMCRIVLAWLFPSVFGTHVPAASDSGDSEETIDPTITIGQKRTRSSNGQWCPYSGPAKTEGVNCSIIHHSHQSSEEYILHDIENDGDENFEGAIRKTTHYEISYEPQYTIKESV